MLDLVALVVARVVIVGGLTNYNIKKIAIIKNINKTLIVIIKYIAQSLPPLTVALVTASVVVGAVEAPASWPPSAYVACCLVVVGGLINNSYYHTKYY